MRAFVPRPKAGAASASLAIGSPSNSHEREADQIAEQVMRAPESPTNGLTCQTKPYGSARDMDSSEAPAIVHAVLRAGGQPLDAATRGWMEPRFGHDFSKVRVHTDAQSAESAHEVSSLAYTVGNHVVFGAGQFAPGSNEGRRLLAHELAHVSQQFDVWTLQRKPDPAAEAEVRREKRLEELAKDPAEAHKAWKKLNAADRKTVADRMRQRYGVEFAQHFRDVVKEGKPQLEVLYYQPGVGPTPEQLSARGYRRAGSERTGNAAFDVEIWVHPTGKTVRRDVSTWKFGTSQPGTKPGTGERKRPVRQPPEKETVPDPPVTTTPRHDEALELLESLKAWNSNLQNFCDADPFVVGDAENALIEWNFSREQLREFTDLDWSRVDPEFWKQVAEEADENLERRRACCKRDPTNYWFDCGTLPRP